MQANNKNKDPPNTPSSNSASESPDKKRNNNNTPEKMKSNRGKTDQNPVNRVKNPYKKTTAQTGAPKTPTKASNPAPTYHAYLKRAVMPSSPRTGKGIKPGAIQSPPGHKRSGRGGGNGKSTPVRNTEQMQNFNPEAVPETTKAEEKGQEAVDTTTGESRSGDADSLDSESYLWNDMTKEEQDQAFQTWNSEGMTQAEKDHAFTIWKSDRMDIDGDNGDAMDEDDSRAKSMTEEDLTEDKPADQKEEQTENQDSPTEEEDETDDLEDRSDNDPMEEDDDNLSNCTNEDSAVEKTDETTAIPEQMDEEEDESDNEAEGDDTFDDNSGNTAATKTKHKEKNNGMNPSRQTKMRLSCRIKLDAHKIPLYSLVAGLQAQMDWLQSNDPSIVLYPWFDNVLTIVKHRIHSSGDIPKTTQGIAQFFDKKTKPRGQKGGLLYIHMYIGTDLPDWKHFESVQLGTAPEDHKIWYKDLQTDSTTDAGWLLYSLPHFDTETFKEKLKETYNLDIGLRYRMISNGSYGKLDDDQISRAWHIEVSTQTMREDLPKLRDLFRAEKNDHFVEGKKLRLIPEYSAVNLKSRETVAIRREKQKLFVKNIMKTTSGSLVAIDTNLTADGTTPRDLIMAIPHPGRPEWSLFASVDRTWQASFYRT